MKIGDTRKKGEMDQHPPSPPAIWRQNRYEGWELTIGHQSFAQVYLYAGKGYVAYFGDRLAGSPFPTLAAAQRVAEFATLAYFWSATEALHALMRKEHEE